MLFTLKKSKFIFVSILTLNALLFTACNEIEVDDGEIPQQYRQAVQPYMGTYSGKIKGVNTQITISMHGNKPILTVSNNTNNDITGSNCWSKVGDLISFQATEHNKTAQHNNKTYSLEYANFDFDRGMCFVSAGEVTLKIVSPTEFNLELEERDDRLTECPPSASRPGPIPQDPTCNEIGQVTYIRANFKK